APSCSQVGTRSIAKRLNHGVAAGWRAVRRVVAVDRGDGREFSRPHPTKECQHLASPIDANPAWKIPSCATGDLGGSTNRNYGGFLKHVIRSSEIIVSRTDLG